MKKRKEIKEYKMCVDCLENIYTSSRKRKCPFCGGKLEKKIKTKVYKKRSKEDIERRAADDLHITIIKKGTK